MTSTIWTERYRPTKLVDVTGQESIKRFLLNIIQGGITNAPHLILYGPPGTGKTTMALAFAKDVYPTINTQASSMYLNASDERTIETVRERIREFLRTYWTGVKRKIVIFDEVETMTEAAQLTLRALMDSPIVQGTQLPLFIFLCNTLNRIVPLIRSRAVALFCGHLTSNQIHGLLDTIQTKEGLSHPLPTPLACLINRGDMRAFLQRAQSGQDPNMWLPWFQRLMNSPQSEIRDVFQEGLRSIPAWILFRHILVFCYSMGIAEIAEKKGSWVPFIQAVVRCRMSTSFEPVYEAWGQVANSIVP
jgi:hypothetical protein